MRFFKDERRIFLLSVFLMVLSLFALAQASLKARAASDKSSEDFLRFSSMMAEVYEMIHNRYVEDVETDKLFEASIQGMFRALDEHSHFLSADAYEQLNKETEGAFSGVGIHITIRNGVLTVIAPIPGSPAARLGIMPWDRIVKIEGEDTKDITLQEAVRKLTGLAGTKVNVTVYRPSDNRMFDLTITRADIEVDSVYARMLDDEIGYARITKFANNTSGDLKRALMRFQKQGAQAVVLDLRFNTGGLLKEAISVSDLFLKQGAVIVSTRGRGGDQEQVYKSAHDPVTRLPVVILLNDGSASASEIVAAALKENDRALLVGPEGKRTFGKWSVQTIEELSHGINVDEEGNPRKAAVRLTTAKYYSPQGHTYHGEGLAFDEEVEIPKEHERDLFTGGHLLGDPNMVESKETELDHFPTEEEIENGGPKRSEVEEDEREPAIEDIDTSPSADAALSTGTATGDQPFKDIVLEHAVRLLKAHLKLATKAA